jgi:tetratricopeptide (TPR) repeat protein
MPAFAIAASAQGIGYRNRAADSGGGTYTIQGRVYMPDGRPAQNVKVEISNPDAPTFTAYTNSDGVFQTGSVRAGNFTFSVRVPGLPAENEILTIDRDSPQGRTFTVTLFLRTEGQKKGDFYSNNPNFKDVPKPALDKFKQGVEKMKKDDAKGAAASFDEAITAYPNFAAAYYEKGSALLKENQPDAALEAFVKAISIKPDYLEAKYSVGYTQYLKKNYEVAAAIFDDVLKQKAMPEAHMYLGISLYYLKNVPAAESQLKSAVTNDGTSVALAHRYLGGIYLQQKKNADAAAELQKYLDLVPKTPDADKLKKTIADLKKAS